MHHPGMLYNSMIKKCTIEPFLMNWHTKFLGHFVQNCFQFFDTLGWALEWSSGL